MRIRFQLFLIRLHKELQLIKILLFGLVFLNLVSEVEKSRLEVFLELRVAFQLLCERLVVINIPKIDQLSVFPLADESELFSGLVEGAVVEVVVAVCVLLL